MEQKKKICKNCKKEKRLWARGLCQSCDILANPKKYMIERNTKKTKAKKESITTLKKKLDEVFSLYIRQKYEKNGVIECYTCGVVKPLKEMQNAHFWSRSHLSTRWEEKNCRVCCVGCNVFKHGNYIEYTRRLLKEIGQDEFDKLELQKNTPIKINKVFLQENIDFYTKKLK